MPMITQLSSPGASLKTYFSQLETGDLVPEDSRFRGLCGPGLGVEIDGSFVTGVSHVPLHQLRQTPCPPCPRLQQLWLKILGWRQAQGTYTLPWAARTLSSNS